MTLERLAPVLPVRDLNEAIDHYRALGFSVRAYTGDAAYAYADLDGVKLHLSEVAGLDPGANTSAVYLFVDDADALHRQWHEAGLGGRLVAPSDMAWGLREGAHVDPSGNLLRFGTRLT